MMSRSLLHPIVLFALLGGAACGTQEGSSESGGGSSGVGEDGSTGPTATAGEAASGSTDASADDSSTGAPTICGDGLVEAPEECEPSDADTPCADDCRLRHREAWGANEEGRIYNAVAVDAAGNVYAAGYAFDRTDDDLVVQAYGPDGAPLWMYSKDSGAGDDDVATDIALMPTGEVTVVGVVHAHDFAFSEEIEVFQLDPVTGERGWGLGLPKLADHTVPERARVAVNAAGAMVVTYNESGQGSLAALNYVFFDARGGWAAHVRREDDRSVVNDVAAGPDGQFAMLHFQEPPLNTDFVPGVEVHDDAGAFVSLTPLTAEGDYPLRDAQGLAYASDGSLRVPAWTNVVALDASLANDWSVRFDEANSSIARTVRVGPGGVALFAGPRSGGEDGSFLATVTAEGEPGWYLALDDPGATAIDRNGEFAAVVGQIVGDEGELRTWVRGFDVRFDEAE